MFRTPLVVLAVLAALPAAAQDRGGVQMRDPQMRDPMAVVDRIDAKSRLPDVGDQRHRRGEQIGRNRILGATAVVHHRRQRSIRMPPAGQHAGGCRRESGVGPRVFCQPGNSRAGSTRRVLATTTYTRGYNVGYGAMSSANQRPRQSDRPMREPSMFRCSRTTAFAVLSILWCGVSASAETMRCQSVNGNVNCAGSGGVSCRDRRWKEGLRQRPWRCRPVIWATARHRTTMPPVTKARVTTKA